MWAQVLDVSSEQNIAFMFMREWKRHSQILYG